MRKRNALSSLDLLRGFEAAARHLSFTKAADELCVTQSAISRQIGQLEEQMGVRLFERRTRAVLLTDVGRLYYREIHPILQQIQQITQKVMAERHTSRLRVTTTLTFGSLWFVPKLAEFQAQQPHIHVHVVADNVLRDLARDNLDVAIRYSTRAEAGSGAIKLFDEKLIPVCSPKLLSSRSLRNIEDLRHFALIHFNDLEGRAPWLSWDTWFSGMKHPEIHGKSAAYFSHYEQAMRAAQAGQGVALGRIPVIDPLLQEGKLVAPLGRRKGAVTLKDRAYWLMTRESSSAVPEVEVFLAWLRESARQIATERAAASF